MNDPKYLIEYKLWIKYANNKELLKEFEDVVYHHSAAEYYYATRDELMKRLKDWLNEDG